MSAVGNMPKRPSPPGAADSVYDAQPNKAAPQYVRLISPAAMLSQSNAKPVNPAMFYPTPQPKKNANLGGTLLNSNVRQAVETDYDSASGGGEDMEPPNSYLTMTPSPTPANTEAEATKVADSADKTAWAATSEKMQKASSSMFNTNIYSVEAPHSYDRGQRQSYSGLESSSPPSYTSPRKQYRRSQSPIDQAKFEKFYQEYLKWQEQNLINETESMKAKTPAAAVVQRNRYEYEPQQQAQTKTRRATKKQTDKEDEQQLFDKLVTFEDSSVDGLEVADKALEPTTTTSTAPTTTTTTTSMTKLTEANSTMTPIKQIASESSIVPTMTTLVVSNNNVTTDMVETTTIESMPKSSATILPPTSMSIVNNVTSTTTNTNNTTTTPDEEDDDATYEDEEEAAAEDVEAKKKK